MSIKILLLVLFLYTLLAWGVAFYIDPEDFVHRGLLYTLIGIGAMLAYVLGSAFLGWVRVLRLKRAARPAPIPAAGPQATPQHPDVTALQQLLGEARQRVAESLPVRTDEDALAALPLYLLVGPESSGKTSAVIQSGLDARLLAGQGRMDGIRPSSTPSANIWLVDKRVLFAEIGGTQFSGDLEKWKALLGTFAAKRTPRWIDRFMKPVPVSYDLRGVMLFRDAASFSPSHSSDGGAQARHAGDRLNAISAVFRRRFPVYNIVSKIDTIRYFPEYIARFTAGETPQPVGCTVPVLEVAGSSYSRENQVKDWTRAFNGVYMALADRRTMALYSEQDAANKPKIYEFPREFRRIRETLVEHMAEVFHPRDMHPGAINRGFYFTGRREVDIVDASPQTDSVVIPLHHQEGGDATRFFSLADVAKMGAGARPAPPAGRRETRWVFVKDLFQDVILKDQPLVTTAVITDTGRTRNQTIAAAVAIALGTLMAFAWAVSWVGNVQLLRKVRTVAEAQRDLRSGPIQASDWQSADEFRQQVGLLGEHAREGTPWSLNWGLYTGDAVYPDARTAYLRRIRRLAVEAAHARIVTSLIALPAQPDTNAAYEPAASEFKTHLMLSSGGCKMPPLELARVLKDNLRASGAQVPGPPDLVDRQIDAFAEEVAENNPVPFQQSADAKRHATSYLSRVRGIDRIYQALLAKADGSAAPAKLSSKVSDYAKVLRGPDEIRAAYTPRGWTLIQAAIRSGEFKMDDDPCITSSTSPDGVKLFADMGLARKIEDRYARDYAEAWKRYLSQFSVPGYAGAPDAARKLSQLEGYKSPLLALFSLAADNTSFPVSGTTSQLQKVPILGDMLKKADQKATKANKAIEAVTGPEEKQWTMADVTRVFQPVHWVVAPNSEKWITEKNTPYADGLGGLRRSMESIANDKPDNPDCNVHKSADEAYKRAEDGGRQLAKGFDPASDVSAVADGLLQQPIRAARGYIRTNCDPAEITKGKANGELRAFCAQLQPVLRQYPFGSGGDLNIDDLRTFFAPKSGRVWAFQAQSLKFAAREGANWKQNPAVQEPVATEGLLRFLDRAQQITDAFFADGSPQPHFSIALRPEGLRGSPQVIILSIHGREHTFSKDSILQQQFSWPATVPASGEARGRTGAKGLTAAFSSHQGPWALFRFLGDADDRPVGQKSLVWSESRGASGTIRERIETPVRLSIVEFPGGADIFSRKFWSDFRCPGAATQ